MLLWGEYAGVRHMGQGRRRLDITGPTLLVLHIINAPCTLHGNAYRVLCYILREEIIRIAK